MIWSLIIYRRVRRAHRRREARRRACYERYDCFDPPSTPAAHSTNSDNDDTAAIVATLLAAVVLFGTAIAFLIGDEFNLNVGRIAAITAFASLGNLAFAIVGSLEDWEVWGLSVFLVLLGAVIVTASLYSEPADWGERLRYGVAFTALVPGIVGSARRICGA